jgi:IS30 family transposase
MTLTFEAAQALAERRALVAELTWEGWTAKRIAARLSVTPRTVIRDRVKMDEHRILGIAQPARRLLTDEECRRAQELLDDGYSLMEVARTLNRSAHTIGRRFKGQGWTLAETGQFNSLTALRKRLGV